MRVDVKPELLQWACERAGSLPEAYSPRFPQLPRWIAGTTRPTLRQLEDFAKAVHAPIGFFFLPRPPQEQVPIPDFRTMPRARGARPSADLLDTVYLCQQRQEWFLGHARVVGEDPLDFVGSRRTTDAVESVAAEMRRRLGLDLEERRHLATWTEAGRRFLEQAEALGVLVMTSGVVGGNSHRRLDPAEFRGFALADPLAPLVFVNGADTKAAQMFTLAHELAHVWLGATSLSDAAPDSDPTQDVERWCNRVAAELLVPLLAIRAEHRRARPLREELDRLARQFKVSTLVVLRRLHDAGALSREALRKAYDDEAQRLQTLATSGGGDFYRTLGARTGKRFARAVVTSALEGRTSFTDAFRMLGLRKMATFDDLGRSLGVLA